MEEPFEIPVLFKGKERLYPAEVIRYGYVHRIVINVEQQVIYLEADEESNYRAIADQANTKEVDRELVRAIVTAVQEILKKC